MVNRPRALEQFLAGVERRAFRLAELVTGNRDDALDIVQDAMYMLVRRYGQRPESEWAPLFQRILQSKTRDWYRRTRVRGRLRVWLWGAADDETDEWADIADERDVDPQQRVQTERTLATLERALQTLPLRQRQVFLLRAWEGLDVAQTAQAVGCSQGSVKTHYARALQKLRVILGEHWP
jgi:RNA polymerase sigma-70 factor (ECF subfamily)